MEEKVKERSKMSSDVGIGIDVSVGNAGASNFYYTYTEQDVGESKFETFQKVLMEIKALVEANNVSIGELSNFLIGGRSCAIEREVDSSADGWISLVTEHLKGVKAYLEENRRLIENIRKQITSSDDLKEVIKKLKKEGEVDGRKD